LVNTSFMGKTGPDSLSAKQLQCLRLVAKGFTSDQIAHEAGIAVGTANYHINQAVKKLGAPGRRFAASMLAEHEAARSSPAATTPSRAGAPPAPPSPLQRSPIAPPENLTSQILRFDPPSYSLPPTLLSEASVHEVEAPPYGDSAPSIFPPDASLSTGGLADDLNKPLRTIALILAIAVLAGLLVLIVPTLLANAQWIADHIDRPDPSRSLPAQPAGGR
jgi:DNA-binding CsgD family transcriptional regulator